MPVVSVLAKLVQTIYIHHGYQRAKRIFDVIFTLLLLLPLCFVMAIVAVLIRLDSKGPIFFRQKRVGQNGVEFEMLKFRFMYVNSDDSIHREAITIYMNGQKIYGSSAAIKFQYNGCHRPRDPPLRHFGYDGRRQLSCAPSDPSTSPPT